MVSQLAKLSRPFPDAFVRKAPQGKFGDYVPHHTVAQALLATLGPYDLHITQILRNAEGVIEGCVVQLVCEIDGRTTTIEEAGDCEQPSNWKTDGARLKDAVSDGLKRCAARVGLGLHLWSGPDYFLHDSLIKREAQCDHIFNDADGAEALCGKCGVVRGVEETTDGTD